MDFNADCRKMCIRDRRGIEEFAHFIKMENFMPLVESGEMIVFGAVEGQDLGGVGAVRRDGHISLLFIRPDLRRKGIAKALVGEMCRYCTDVYKRQFLWCFLRIQRNFDHFVSIIIECFQFFCTFFQIVTVGVDQFSVYLVFIAAFRIAKLL